MKNLKLYITITIIFLIVFSNTILTTIVLNAGKSNFEKGNYLEAHKILNFGLKLQPKNKSMRYYYLKTLMEFKSTYKIQKKIFEFSQSNMEDSAQTVALAKVGEWQYQITQTYGRTYIDNTPYNTKVLRWDVNTFPLRVYIDNASKFGLPNYYTDEISKSFNSWQRAANFLRFKYTNNKKEADIVVEYLPPAKTDCRENGCKYVVAYTVPEIKGNRLKKMTIKVYSKDPNGNLLSNKELHNTVIHEIGHALGVMGHSPHLNDLMYMSTNQNQLEKANSDDFVYITAADINTMRLLYNLMPDISNTPIEKIKTTNLLYSPIVLGDADEVKSNKLDEAKRYVASAPNISGGYIDLGVAYAETGKIKQAKEAFNKALKLAKNNEQRSIAYFNLAVVSLNSNQHKDAYNYAQKAHSYYPSEETKELIETISQYLEKR